MPAHKLLPPDNDLLRMVQDGMTHAQIAEEIERTTGQKVARSTVSAALSRAALTQTTGRRYRETVPWRVRPEHSTEYAVRMLRLLGRRREGLPLDDDLTHRLEAWLAMLEREEVVVAYCPEHEDGFLYVDASFRQGPNDDIPIRVKTLRLDEITD